MHKIGIDNMAYFSNGTEFEIYKELYCRKCVHDIDSDCPIILVHSLYNYNQFESDEQGKTIRSILNILWPVDSKDTGFLNEDCKLFIAQNRSE